MPPDDYYSPRRVELLLREIPTFYARQTPREGESLSGSRLWRNPVEGRMAVMGDLLRAIEALSAFQQIIVWECAVYGRPYRAVAVRLGVSHTSIGREKRRAIEDMAYRLGWRPSGDVDRCSRIG